VTAQPVQPIENATGSGCLTTEDYAARLPGCTARGNKSITPLGL